MIEHELVVRFKSLGVQLSDTLTEMLNEHFSHCTERRGCGFTQATRHLATLINIEPAERTSTRVNRGIFAEPKSIDRSRLVGWDDGLEREESQLLAGMISALLELDHTHDLDLPVIRSYPQALKVGSCPMAEKYFLELAHGFINRRGRMNLIVDRDDRPLLVEKQNLGDEHSCLSIAPLILNGVVLPIGSLFAVSYPSRAIIGEKRGECLPGAVIAIEHCDGFRFLRLSTLAVSPKNRARAFSSHFEAQIEQGLFAPAETRIEQLLEIAQYEIARHHEFQSLMGETPMLRSQEFHDRSVCL